MEKQISSGLKIVFLIHFIVGSILGLVFILIPEVYASLISWPIEEPPLYRLIGAAIIGFSASSWFAYKNPVWDMVKIIVLMEIIWTVLGSLVLLWGMLFEDLPAIAWMNTTFLAVFAVAFVYYFLKERE